MEDIRALLVSLTFLALLCALVYKGYKMAEDPKNRRYKGDYKIINGIDKSRSDHSKGWRIFWKTVLFFVLGAFLNIFGLIAWLIIFFCWKGKDQSQNNSNKYQELYYKELYKAKKRENEKELKKELQEENNE